MPKLAVNTLFDFGPRAKHLIPIPYANNTSTLQLAIASALFQDELKGVKGQEEILAKLVGLLKEKFIFPATAAAAGLEVEEETKLSYDQQVDFAEEDLFRKLNHQTCGLTQAELDFIKLNADRLNFKVNLLGYALDKVYVIETGLGARQGDDKREMSRRTVHLLKMNVARELKTEPASLSGMVQAQYDKEVSKAGKHAVDEKKRKFGRRIDFVPELDVILQKNETETSNDPNVFFFAIRNIDELLRKEYNVEGKKSYRKSIHCPTCLRAFDHRGNFFDAHVKHCRASRVQLEVTPDALKQDHVAFTDHKSLLRLPVVCYADFESLLVPMTEMCKECQIGPSRRSRCTCGKQEM